MDAVGEGPQRSLPLEPSGHTEGGLANHYQNGVGHDQRAEARPQRGPGLEGGDAVEHGRKNQRRGHVRDRHRCYQEHRSPYEPASVRARHLQAVAKGLPCGCRFPFELAHATSSTEPRARVGRSMRRAGHLGSGRLCLTSLAPHRPRGHRLSALTSVVAVDDDLAYADVFALRRRPATAEGLVEVLLGRVNALDAPGSPSALRSVLAVSETVISEARACDRSDPIGPLHGVPVLVKDNIEVAGLPSTAGATSLAGRPARRDAPLVRRLRDAGAVIMGTANLSEWANIRSARSTSGWSAVGGLTGNPWALDRNAGRLVLGFGGGPGRRPRPAGHRDRDGRFHHLPVLAQWGGGDQTDRRFHPDRRRRPHQRQSGQPRPNGSDRGRGRPSSGGAYRDARRPGTGPGGCRPACGSLSPAPGLRGTRAPTALFEEAVARVAEAGGAVHDVQTALPSSAEDEDELTVLLCELVDGLAAYLPTRGPGGPQDLAQVVAHEKRHASTELAHFGHDLFERALELGGTGTDAYRAARARNLAWAVGSMPGAGLSRPQTC